MKSGLKIFSVFLVLTAIVTHVMSQEVRTIVFNQDLDQKYMCTKVFELKHMRADDITPFVLGAVRRYNAESDVQRLNYKFGKKHFIVVSTGVDMMPYVEDMIKKLDRPCNKKDANGSIVDGDGIYRFTYYAKYRATDNMRDTLRWCVSDGTSYFDQATNLFYWKDSLSDGTTFLKFLKAIDRPVPQLSININVYEMTENDFTELGIDYVSWKNGPGAQLLGLGAEWSKFSSALNLGNVNNMLNILNSGPVASPGLGFMVAPQFDATFLRMLTQKGRARTCSSGYITVINDFNADPGNDNFAAAKYRIKFTPDYQNIEKDNDQNVSVSAIDDQEFYFYIRSPIIGFNDAATEAATIMFGWVLNVDDVVEKSHDGTPVVNQQFFRSWITLASGTEKLIATYTKELDVEQYNGLPFLGDIPVLKYLTGAQAHSKSHSRIFVTVRATPVLPDTDLSEWAGKVITAAEMLRDEEN